MAKYDIYLTSTFRHDWNRRFNPRIGDALERAGVTCYLPHRDTDQAEPPAHRFREDMAGIEASRMVLAIAVNESPNWGAEVGFAYGRGMPVIALTPSDHDIPLILNGMVTQALRVGDMDAVEDYLPALTALILEYKN